MLSAHKRMDETYRDPAFLTFWKKKRLLEHTTFLHKKSYLFYIEFAFCYNNFAFLQSVRNAQNCKTLGEWNF